MFVASAPTPEKENIGRYWSKKVAHCTIKLQKKNYRLKVFYQTNRTQAAERAENAIFVPGDLDL